MFYSGQICFGKGGTLHIQRLESYWKCDTFQLKIHFQMLKSLHMTQLSTLDFLNEIYSYHQLFGCESLPQPLMVSYESVQYILTGLFFIQMTFSTIAHLSAPKFTML